MISKRMVFGVTLFLLISSFFSAQSQFWVQTNGPTGGRVMSITIDVSGKLYCGTQGGTLFEYSNNKKSWKPIFLGATRDNIIAIVTDKKKRIYFATTNDGVFRSAEQGNTWEKISASLKDLEITGLDILHDGTLFLGTKSGLYKSVDRGVKWSKVEQFAVPINAIRVHKHIVYVAYDDTLISYSTDGGQNWERLQMQGNLSPTCLAIGNDQRIYVGTTEGDVFEYGIKNGIWKKLAHFEYSISVLQADQHENIYISLGGPAFSNEGGGFFLISATHKKPKLLSTNTIWCMAIRNNVVYTGTATGIFYSHENKTKWLPLNSGLIAQRVNDIVINKNDALFVGTYGGVFRSEDNGDTWIEKNKGLDEIGIVDMAINNKGDLFIGTYSSSIFFSSDNGNTWHKKSKGIPVKNSHWIMNIAINSKDHLFAAVLAGGVYRSLDHGDTWIPVNEGLEIGRYTALIIDSKDVVFSANEKGNVFRSTNNGETWQKLASKNPIDDVPAELVVDNENSLYFGAVEKGIFRYSEKDQSWLQLNTGLSNTTIRSMIFINKDLFFAGTSGAKDYKNFHGEDVYKSFDKGGNWLLENSGLNHPRIKALAVNSKGFLFAGTWGGGVYKTVYPVMSRK